MLFHIYQHVRPLLLLFYKSKQLCSINFLSANLNLKSTSKIVQIANQFKKSPQMSKSICYYLRNPKGEQSGKYNNLIEDIQY
jgi:hypothetical protein